MQSTVLAMGAPEMKAGVVATNVVTEDLESGFALSGLPKGPRLGKPTQQRQPRSYLDLRVAPKLDERPWLTILAQFLDPDDQNFAGPQEHRLWDFNVKVVKVLESVVNSPITCETESSLHHAIAAAEDERCGFVIIAENMSCAMVDALGSHFNIEPEFFACHLVGTESFRKGVWQPDEPVARTPHALSSYLRKAPFYTLLFRRPYYIKGGLPIVKQLRTTVTNTPRGVQYVNLDMPTVFVTEKVSVYKRKGSNFAIILTDKPLNRELPESYMRDVIASPDEDPDCIPNSYGNRRLSSEEELLTWLQRIKPEEAKSLFDDQAPIALRPILKIVETACFMFLRHAWHIMTRINVGQTDKAFPNNIPFFLKVSRNLERQMHDQLKILTRAIRLAAFRGGEKLGEEIQDLNCMSQDLRTGLSALEEDVRFIIFAASMNEGRIIGWITKFAYLFLPLSLLAGILAVPSDNNNVRFIVMGALGVPFVLASTWLMYFWKPSELDSLRI